MYALAFPISLLSLSMSVVSMTCLDDPWHEGFSPKLFNLHVVDLRESFCLARLIVEPSSRYGDLCPCAMACSATIERGGMFVAPRWAPSRGAVAVDPGRVAPICHLNVHQDARRSRAGHASWGLGRFLRFRLAG